MHLLYVLFRDLGLAILLNLLNMLHLMHVNDLTRLLFLRVDFGGGLLLNLNLVVNATVSCECLLVFQRQTTSAVA